MLLHSTLSIMGKEKPSAARSTKQARPAAPESVSPSLASLLGKNVVLDTAGPITYLGRLVEIRHDGLWLADADLRDRTEGHHTKEQYICESRIHGIRANRRRIFVCAQVVISVSALDDVIVD